MINLNIKKRDLENISDQFYSRIENSILSKIGNHLNFLNTFFTDSSKTPLGDFLEKEIPDIIKSPLDDAFIKKYNDELKILFENNYKLIGTTFSQKKIPTAFKNIIDQIFFYESHNTWKAYQVSVDIGANTCAYCNRTYITTIGNDSDKFVRGDFDHFLAKSLYPYFRLSFYNLIPCCIICNRNAKGDDETSLEKNIYPYKEGFENKTVFTFYPRSYEDLIGKGRPEIDFLFLGDVKHKEKSKANIKLFKLKEQYSIQTQELNDILNKRRIFSNSYLEKLQNDYPALIKNFNEAYLLAFGKEFDLIHDEERPLSKFTRDIVEELDMIIKPDAI